VTAATIPSRPASQAGRASFRSALGAEWIKFRTVRGWLAGLLLAALFAVLFTFLVANGNHQSVCTGNGVCGTGHPFVPAGPDGEAVADSYQYLGRSLTGDGTLTTEVSSLTGLIWNGPANRAPSLADTRPGLAAWTKAGILVTPSTKPGSAYAAVMATGGHGVRFQHDYTHDQAGLPGSITNSATRWLRLTRTGDTLTGYDSADGTTWREIGTARLTGLPTTVSIGLFVTSPVSYQASGSGAATQATATFHQVSLAGQATGPWQSHSIGTTQEDYYPTLGNGSSRRTGTTAVLTGSGDIAPAVALAGGNTASGSLLFGIVVALIVLIVIATMFITTEYRRGLIRTTFTATPARGSVLAAKATVVGAVAFVAGALAAAVAIPLGDHVLDGNGNYVFPATALTLVRIIAGTGILLTLTAIAVLALGAVVRRSAGAITAGILVFVLPSLIGPGILGPGASGGAATWLYRITPAAGFSALAALPRSALVDYPYTLANGYYPLPPWAGLAVLGLYAIAALALAAFLLRRRDA
jgi:ABC-type transport system involved in multi-copper enzyme maturation permease subunit